MAGARTHGLGAVPPSDRWHASVPFGISARSRADDPLRRPGCPSDDPFHQGVEERMDLLAEDRDLPGGFDAQADLAVRQLRHRHDDPIADQDPLTEFARQDEHGGLLSLVDSSRAEAAKRTVQGDGDDPNR
jgi:hypothetical protein